MKWTIADSIGLLVAVTVANVPFVFVILSFGGDTLRAALNRTGWRAFRHAAEGHQADRRAGTREAVAFELHI